MHLKWFPHWKSSKSQSVPTQDSVQGGDGEDTPHVEPQATASLALPVSADMILESLREVEDPELGIGIVDLGLVYGIELEPQKVSVKMTLTSPGCPIGPMLQAAVHGAVKRVCPDVEDIKVDLVWNPPWDPYKMASEEAKDMLGIW